MAEQVSSLLRRSVEHLADEVPDSYRLVLEALGPLLVEVDVDGERFALRGGQRLEVSEGPASMAGAQITTSRAAILDLLDAKVGLDEAVQVGAVGVRGPLDDILRAHATLLAYVHAAIRAPSQPALLCALRRGAIERTHHDACPALGVPRWRCWAPASPPHRCPRTGGARLRGHGVRTPPDERCAGRRRPGGQLPPSSSAASPPLRYSKVGPATAPPSCALPGRRGNREPRTGGCGRARASGFFPAYTSTLGPVPTHPGLSTCRAGRRDLLADDVTHRHGQRQTSRHSRHHG